MYRVTLFTLAAFFYISTVFGTDIFDDINDNGPSFFNNPERYHISTTSEVTAGLGAVMIVVIVLVSLCPFAVILCCCCCACCPCYYCCRSRTTNVTVVSPGGGGGGPVQNNFSLSIPSPQPVMQQQYAPMAQQYAPMPQQYTQMPEPDTVISQHPPPQYTQGQYNQPQASATSGFE